MSNWCIQAVRRVLDQLQALEDGRMQSGDTLDSCILTLELVVREFVLQSSVSCLSEDEHAAEQHTMNALKMLVELKENCDMSSVIGQHPPTSHSGNAGRPPFLISKEQLQYLVENQFSVPQISTMLGVSSRTIERRMNSFGISMRDTYADLTNSELQTLVAGIQSEHPMCGNRHMRGHLIARGFRVQQYRIREVQRAVDPEGSAMRKLHTINRRSYSVPGPRSLWHIDGNHKLIRLVN